MDNFKIHKYIYKMSFKLKNDKYLLLVGRFKKIKMKLEIKKN